MGPIKLFGIFCKTAGEIEAVMQKTDKSNHCALLVIDVQKGLFNNKIPIYNANTFLNNIKLLVGKAHSNQTPVIFIQHSNDSILKYGTNEWKIHPAITPTDNDFLIHKKHGNAFEETNLTELLQSKSVDCLVITGLVTHGCVKATCIGALELGYQVTLVEDAHSSYSKDAANLIIKWNQKLHDLGAKILKTKEIDF